MSGLLPRLAIDSDVSPDVFNTLSEKVCKQAGSDFTGGYGTSYVSGYQKLWGLK